MSSKIRHSAMLLLVVLAASGCKEDESGGPATVEVVYGDNTVGVDLADMDAISVASVDSARLSDVVEAADLGVDLAALEFDFEASDGFRSSNSSNCTGIVPIAGEDLDFGYIALESRDLTWDESMDAPGCLRVDDVARLHATDVN